MGGEHARDAGARDEDVDLLGEVHVGVAYGHGGRGGGGVLGKTPSEEQPRLTPPAIAAKAPAVPRAQN